MFSNNFEMRRGQARKLDEMSLSLSETWRVPSVLVGGYAECTDETISYAETVLTTLRDTQDNIERSLANSKLLSDDKEGFEMILEQSEAAYKDLKSQCEDLEIVLQEYGYHYEDSNVASCDTKSLEVEFTPQLSWKCKTKLDSRLLPESVSYLQKHESTITPTNKTLTFIMGMDTPAKGESKGTYTPGRDNRPQEPIYSNHFYNARKKL